MLCILKFQPVESQVMISVSFGLDKIKPRPPQQNLVKMTRAMLEKEEIFSGSVKLVEVRDLELP